MNGAADDVQPLAFKVDSANVSYTEEAILSRYVYQETMVQRNNGQIKVVPKETVYNFKTERHVPRTGLMMVGWGGNVRTSNIVLETNLVYRMVQQLLHQSLPIARTFTGKQSKEFKLPITMEV